MKMRSDFKSRKDWEDFVWLSIIKNLKRAKSEKNIEIFLSQIVGSYERRAILKRVAIMALIKQGKTYREIGEIIWVSPTTISSIKKCAREKKGYRSRRELSLLQNKKGTKRAPDKSPFGDWFNFPPPPTMVGKGRWRFLNYQR